MASSVKVGVGFAATALTLAMGLTGCGRPAQDANSATAAATLPPLPGALPLATGPVAPSAPAPSVAALLGRTPAQRARLADPGARYAYLDRAYGQSAAADVAPPDYVFDYGGVRPWAWDAGDRSREIIEPVPGGYRYYYYSPGADAPYLVRDPDYVYAYDGPALVAVFDREGRALPPDPGYDQALYAGRYLTRARALYAASLQANRSSVIAADWAAHRAEVAAARSEWAAQQARQAEWRAYHAEHQAEEQNYWQGERARREAAAAWFDDWHTRSFSGPPPVLYAAAAALAAVALAVAARPAQVPVAVIRPVVASRAAPQASAPTRPVLQPAPRAAAVQPRGPGPAQLPFVARQRLAAERVPIVAPPPTHFARSVEFRPATPPHRALPVVPTPPHIAPPVEFHPAPLAHSARPPHYAPLPERVVVVRGAEMPHIAPQYQVEAARPHDPPAAPSRQIIAAARPPEPHHAAPPSATHSHAPEQRPADHHAEPAHGQDHAHDHR